MVLSFGSNSLKNLNASSSTSWNVNSIGYNSLTAKTEYLTNAINIGNDNAKYFTDSLMQGFICIGNSNLSYTTGDLGYDLQEVTVIGNNTTFVNGFTAIVPLSVYNGTYIDSVGILLNGSSTSVQDTFAICSDVGITASNQGKIGRTTCNLEIYGSSINMNTTTNNFKVNSNYVPYGVSPTTITGAITLSAPAYGTYLVANAAAAALNITLMLSSSVPVGAVLLFRRSSGLNSGFVVSIQRQGTDVIYALNSATGVASTAILAVNVYNGKVMKLSTGVWAIVP